MQTMSYILLLHMFSFFPLTFLSHSIFPSHFFINKLSSLYPLTLFSSSLYSIPSHSLLPLALPLSVFPFSLISHPLCGPVCSSFPSFSSSSHLSSRSWRSVSAIITMQSCSLSERLTATASRRSNSSQNKSCQTHNIEALRRSRRERLLAFL